MRVSTAASFVRGTDLVVVGILVSFLGSLVYPDDLVDTWLERLCMSVCCCGVVYFILAVILAAVVTGCTTKQFNRTQCQFL